MIKASRIFKVLTIAIIISLIASLFMTVDAIADDTTPPPPAEEQTISETEETVPADETLGDILEQLPENTTVVLVTPQGIEPLATVLAEDLILIGDPIWCPEGVAPIPGDGGCTISYVNLSTLVYNITEPTADGVIWITAGADTSPSFISIDGVFFTNWSNYNLTIQGGWNGDNVGTITSTTSFSNPIEIINWSGNVTVNDIIANNVGSTGLSIETSGDITLSNLTLNNNDYSGLSANSGRTITAENISVNNNDAGPGAEFSGTEVILNGNNDFSGNGETGIYITTTGNITINNITADNNGAGGYGSGAELASTSGAVTLTGTNQFNNNNDTGIVITADRAINTENVTANNNGAGGNYGSGAELTSTSGDVTLSGTNEFSNNNDAGLYVDADGAINTENITADNNGSGGAELLSTSGDVTLSGLNQFNSNYGTGLHIEAGGVVGAENITASNNGTSGTYGAGVEFFASGLNITGTNEFNNNTESGIFANIDGNITLANITSTGNGGAGNYGVGAELISTGSVNIAGMNVFSANYSGGLAIDAITNISILNAEVMGNFDTGLYFSSLGEIILDCTAVIGNDGYGVDADTPSLLLYGTEIAQNANGSIVSAEEVSYISNSCFTYPVPIPPEHPTPVPPPVFHPIRVESGETVGLVCSTYGGTIIYLPKGDGALLPCGFGDNARLTEMTSDLIPGTMPRGNDFVSSFDLIVEKDGKPLSPIGDEGSLWYWAIEYDASSDRNILQAYFWDGTGWVNAGLSNLPFIRIFFVVPEELKESNLAILFWNGIAWVELTNELNLGQGRFVTQGGRFDGTYFEAEVNFIGTFVLVVKE